MANVCVSPHQAVPLVPPLAVLPLEKKTNKFLPIHSGCTGVSPRPYGETLWRILITPPPERFRTLPHTSARTRTPVHLSALIRGFPPSSADFRTRPRISAHARGFPRTSADFLPTHFRTRPRLSAPVRGFPRTPAGFRARPRISAHARGFLRMRGFPPRAFPHTSAAFRTISTDFRACAGA